MQDCSVLGRESSRRERKARKSASFFRWREDTSGRLRGAAMKNKHKSKKTGAGISDKEKDQLEWRNAAWRRMGSGHSDKKRTCVASTKEARVFTNCNP